MRDSLWLSVALFFMSSKCSLLCLEAVLSSFLLWPRLLWWAVSEPETLGPPADAAGRDCSLLTALTFHTFQAALKTLFLSYSLGTHFSIYFSPRTAYVSTYQEMVWTWSQRWVCWEFSVPRAEAAHWPSYTCIGRKKQLKLPHLIDR